MATATTKTSRQKMDEILKTMGGTPELIKQFGELLESYVNDQKTLLEEKYNTKLNAAKKLCLEETVQFKANLAKRVQLFLEAKADKIESQMAKQVAIKESTAESDLKKIKSLLEGVQVNERGEVDLQALKKQIGQLQKQSEILKEERNAAVLKANRSNAIAQKVLQRNRTLEEAVKQTVKPLTESVAPATATQPAAKPTATPARRKTGQPATTTVVVTEGVQEGKAPTKTAPVQTSTLSAWDPGSVAANMAD